MEICLDQVHMVPAVLIDTRGCNMYFSKFVLFTIIKGKERDPAKYLLQVTLLSVA